MKQAECRFRFAYPWQEKLLVSAGLTIFSRTRYLATSLPIRQWSSNGTMRIRPLPQLAVSLLIGLYLGMLIFRNPAERSHSHTTVKLQSKREHQSAMLANTGLGSLLSAAAFRAPPGTHQTVVMAEVNDGFYAMAYNMYKQFQSVSPPVRNVVWVALDATAKAKMDDEFLDALVYYNPDEQFEAGSTHFRTPQYNSIVKHKWTLLQRVLELGFNVLVMDVDFVVLRNPFKYFQSLQPVCDLAFYDNMPAFAGQESGDATGVHDLNHVEINTGLLMLQSSQASRLLVSGFLAFLASPAADTSMDDQALFNSFMTRRASNNTTDGMLPSSGNKALRCVEWKGVSVRLLSSVYFGCWEIYFKKNLSDITQETPYAIHYNLLSGAAAKSAMIKRHGFWNSEH